jgi:hypothetical protein
MGNDIIIQSGDKKSGSKVWSTIGWTLVVLLGALVAFQQIFPKIEYVDRIQWRDTTLYETVIETIYDTIIKENTQYVFNIDTVYHTDTIFKDVDTANILKDYFATYESTDTLTNDTSLLAISRYKISENKMVQRDFMYENRIKTEEVFILPNQPTAGLWLEGGFKGNLGTFDIGAGFAIEDNKRRKYGYQYSLISKTHELSFGYKFNFKEIRWLR